MLNVILTLFRDFRLSFTELVLWISAHVTNTLRCFPEFAKPQVPIDTLSLLCLPQDPCRTQVLPSTAVTGLIRSSEGILLIDYFHWSPRFTIIQIISPTMQRRLVTTKCLLTFTVLNT